MGLASRIDKDSRLCVRTENPKHDVKTNQHDSSLEVSTLFRQIRWKCHCRCGTTHVLGDCEPQRPLVSWLVSSWSWLWNWSVDLSPNYTMGSLGAHVAVSEANSHHTVGTVSQPLDHTRSTSWVDQSRHLGLLVSLHLSSDFSSVDSSEIPSVDSTKACMEAIQEACVGAD